MNHCLSPHHSLRMTHAFALALFFAISPFAYGGPGAHGPNGEHLDGPVAATSGNGSATPRLEAHSEDFELVATLGGGELSILVDRYETNEPVLQARLEVQAGDLKAVARFHADHGDYSLDNPKLLAALARPGQHPLVFTLTAGEESDLLEGVLTVTQPVDMSGGHRHANGPDGSHGPDHPPGLGWRSIALIGGFVALGVIGWVVMGRRAASPGTSSHTTPKDA